MCPLTFLCFFWFLRQGDDWVVATVFFLHCVSSLSPKLSIERVSVKQGTIGVHWGSRHNIVMGPLL